jgi:hypothetical protein
MKHRDDPVLIGAVGGSGTRAFSKVLRKAGVYMGDADPQEDAVAFSLFYRRFLADYLRNGDRFPDGSAAEAEEGFAAAVRDHLEQLEPSDAQWGAKNPRTMLMLAFWHQRFPRLRFIHVVRNGLDMAYSGNRIQLRRFGEYLLEGGDERPELERLILYWARANLRAADYGESSLGDRYLCIRHEDLCLEPDPTVRRILDFVGVEDPARLRAAVGEVSRPPTMGRWRDQPVDEVARLVELGADALRRFGYWSPELERIRNPGAGSRV